MPNSQKPVKDDFEDFFSFDEIPTARKTTESKPGATQERKTSSSAVRKPSSAQKQPVKKTQGGGIRRPGAVGGTGNARAAEEKKAQKAKQTALKEKSYRNMKNSRFSRGSSAAMLFLFIIVMLAVGVFSAFLSYTYLVDKYENPITPDSIILDETSTIEFKVEKGARTEDIAAKLKEQGLIKNELIFKIMSKFNGYDDLYKSGVHILSQGLSIDEIMVILSDEPLTVTVMFPEGFTTEQIAERLDANDIVDKDEFLNAVDNIDLTSYSFVPQEKGNMDHRLDGFLFPDTYKFEVDSNPETVIYKMLNRFSDVFKPEYYDRVEKQGLSVLQAITLASYVEEECKVSTERELIARVYYNRLFSEEYPYMECDSTIQYVVKKATGENPSVITGEMLEIDDLYNTYKNKGLTPGPICCPGEASIKAVIEMNEHDYYFYTLKKGGNGAHVFSKTLEEHLAAKEENAA